MWKTLKEWNNNHNNNDNSQKTYTKTKKESMNAIPEQLVINNQRLFDMPLKSIKQS